MQPYDLIVVIIMLWAAIAGYRDGLLKQLFSWVGFVLGLYIAYRYGTTLGERTGMAVPVAFVAICVGVPLVGSWLAALVTKVLDWTLLLGFANRLGGLALSVVKYALLISFVTYFGSMLVTVPESLQNDSFLYGFFQSFGISFWNAL